MQIDQLVEYNRSNQNWNLSAMQLLRRWFTGPLGKTLLEYEQLKVNQALTDLFGYHILQLGCLHGDAFIKASRISHKIILKFEADGNDCQADFISTGDSLALASDEMDVVFMPHVLEYTANPHKLLREVERVLISEGHVVIIGFNPWSLWGLWRILLVWREIPPWHGHFYGLARLKDWLSLLDFELLEVERFFFRPPIKSIRVMDKLGFLEKLGKHCWSFFGGTYIIIAKKRVIPLTPIRMRWRDKRRVINSGIAEPSTRIRDSIYE